jgi:hypothetical protein
MIILGTPFRTNTKGLGSFATLCFFVSFLKIRKDDGMIILGNGVGTNTKGLGSFRSLYFFCLFFENSKR